MTHKCKLIIILCTCKVKLRKKREKENCQYDEFIAELGPDILSCCALCGFVQM